LGLTICPVFNPSASTCNGPGVVVRIVVVVAALVVVVVVVVNMVSACAFTVVGNVVVGVVAKVL
jgi:hypothetical protein